MGGQAARQLLRHGLRWVEQAHLRAGTLTQGMVQEWKMGAAQHPDIGLSVDQSLDISTHHLQSDLGVQLAALDLLDRSDEARAELLAAADVKALDDVVVRAHRALPPETQA